MKRLTFPLLLVTALVTGACTSDDAVDSSIITGDHKITIGDASSREAMSRAGFTEANTRLMVHYVSENKNTSNDPEVTETTNRYMATVATAAVDETNSTTSVSAVYDGTTGTADETTYQRYWDYMHGKNSALAVYAIAVPNKTSLTNTTNKANFVIADGDNVWGKMVQKGQTTAISHVVAWAISTTQTNDTFKDEDLTATNNITGDTRLYYNNKKFEQATGDKALEFKHVLSRITVQVKRNTSSFTDNLSVTKVKLMGFNNAGKYNVETAAYSDLSSNDIDIVGSTTDIASNYEAAFTGLVFPETTIGDANTGAMLTIVANGNSYNVSGKAIADALKNSESTFSKLEAGKNYIIQVTVGLKQIESVQAKLVDWNNVTGTLDELTNARITLSSMESTSGTATTVAYDIYRAARNYSGTDLTNTADIDAFTDKDFGTGYGDKLSLAADATTTSWYWPNSTTFYHFRTIAPQGTELKTATNDYIEIKGGTKDASTDYIWGAPLEETHSGENANHNDYTYDPTTNGYGTYIYKAIGPTKDKISITQFHMMSNIEVELQSETEANGGVNLEGSKVYLVRFAASGTLQVGNALITPTSEITTTKTEIGIINGATATKANHEYRVVPQLVSRGDNAADKIGLVIVTADGNSYLVEDLSLIKVSGSTTETITRWYPGKQYKYTFKIMKKKIESLQAQLVDWTTVTGSIGDDITLEN